MITLGLVFMIFGAVIAAGMAGYLIYRVRKFATAIALEAFNIEKEFMFDGLLSAGIGLGFLLFFLGIPFYWSTPNLAYEWVCIVFGAFLLGSELGVIYTTFRIHFYQTKLDKKYDKWLYAVLLTVVPLMVLTIVLLTEGYANHADFPLINGISWQGGLHWATAESKDANLAWYALCILSGAIYCYLICDHFMYKEYGKHGILESTFLIAFPAGIIGARIWYVIGNWNLEFGPVFNKDPFKMFRMWEGGLTIIGGAIMGIIVGVAWFHWRHKEIKIGKAINIIVPTILVAQAFGRWGNFFNCEVHGAQVSGAAWEWLPTFIYKQMQYSSTSGWANPGNIYVPLFLIESIVNMAGYYILFFGFGKGLKKYIAGGDLALGYIAWYGATRMLMEPLRDGAYNMGTDGRWSWIWGILMVGLGLLAIILNHVIRYIIKNKKEPIEINQETANKYVKNSAIGIAVTLTVSIALIAVGFTLWGVNSIPEGVSNIALVPHNIGLILWINGLCLLPSVVIPSLYLYKGLKFKPAQA